MFYVFLRPAVNFFVDKSMNWFTTMLLVIRFFPRPTWGYHVFFFPGLNFVCETFVVKPPNCWVPNFPTLSAVNSVQKVEIFVWEKTPPKKTFFKASFFSKSMVESRFYPVLFLICDASIGVLKNQMFIFEASVIRSTDECDDSIDGEFDVFRREETNSCTATTNPSG